MIGTGITLLLCLLGFLKVYNEEHLQRWRPAKYYREEEIMIKTDSLLNSWAENEMKRDSL